MEETPLDYILSYNNCFGGALVLMFNLRRSRMGIIWKRTLCPHFYVIDKEGNRWHYKAQKYILPFPFHWILFKGYYKKTKWRQI